jgi:HAD domain in Swiss Army Knife RNA repair proteins
MKILFLDFDGVLHPVKGGFDDQFCHLENLKSIIGDTPVVVSSSWREVFSLEDLKDMLEGVNIIGMTPVSTGGKSWEPMARYFECIAWLKDNNMLDANWRALDDQKSIFELDSPCANLILCSENVGLAKGSNAAIELEKWINS